MKKFLAFLLIMNLCVTVGGALSQEAAQFLTAQELLDRDETALSIQLGEDEVPTLFSVVGRREIIAATSSWNPENGGSMERYDYRSDTVAQDLRAYAAHLLSNDWEEHKAPAEDAAGDAVYTKPSLDGAQTLTVVITCDGEGYAFVATKQESIAWVPEGWTPRMERLTAPAVPDGADARAAAGNLTPASYTPASNLAMGDGRMAYTSYEEEGKLCLAEIGPNWRWETLHAWTGAMPLGAVLKGEGKAVWLLDDGDEEYNSFLQFQDGAEEPRIAALPDSETDGPQSRYGGPMLELPDGTLLVRDQYGAIYISDGEGSSLRAVPGVRAGEFVYHDGFLYFSNLEDQMTHHGVYDENAYEYADFSYPRLYRVALDGTGLEKLTDCGVRGLASQGPHIIYQDLSEPFTLPIPEFSGPDILFGPLYRYETDTGERMALNIHSDAYIPTPWGLAVWYHDFSFEPYEITAELVLHSYDGTPLYRLDAGTREYTGDACVYGDSLCFYGYDWGYFQGDADEEDFLSMVPLDGSPQGDIIMLLDDLPIDDLRVPLDTEELDLSDNGEYGLDSVPLGRLKNLRKLNAGVCEIEDLSEIGKCGALEVLGLWSNEIEDISPLAGLTKLRELDLSDNYISDLSPLMGMGALRTLRLSGNPVEDFSPLYGLTGLETLYIHDIEATPGQIQELMEHLPRTGIYGDSAQVPAVVEDRLPEPLGKPYPPAGEGVPASGVRGGDIAVEGDRIAYVRAMDDTPTLHVLRRQGDAWVLEAEYQSDQPISNVVLYGEMMAYLTGPVSYRDADATCTLEIVQGGESVYSMILGPTRRIGPPYVGPMVRMEDGRLLFADNLGALYVCDMDGSELDKVSGAVVGNFVYSGDTVFYEDIHDLDTQPSIYCREIDEFMDVSFASLKCISVRGGSPSPLDMGVQGLVSWGDRVVFQDASDTFVFQRAERSEDWLRGYLCRYDETGSPEGLGIAVERYIATPYGVACWYCIESGGEGHDESQALLVLHDYEGHPLYALDAKGMPYASYFVGERDVWFQKTEFEGEGESYHCTYHMVRVPLDGGTAEVFAAP